MSQSSDSKDSKIITAYKSNAVLGITINLDDFEVKIYSIVKEAEKYEVEYGVNTDDEVGEKDTFYVNNTKNFINFLTMDILKGWALKVTFTILKVLPKEDGDVDLAPDKPERAATQEPALQPVFSHCLNGIDKITKNFRNVGYEYADMLDNISF